MKRKYLYHFVCLLSFIMIVNVKLSAQLGLEYGNYDVLPDDNGISIIDRDTKKVVYGKLLYVNYAEDSLQVLDENLNMFFLTLEDG